VTYKIVRSYQDDRPAEVVRTGLTLEQAKQHCAIPMTRGGDWFDGWTKEGD
jgi:hypothetical protein